ncbi:MAG: hypothetical protein ACYC09_00335 [Bacteroidota bacterium]
MFKKLLLPLFVTILAVFFGCKSDDNNPANNVDVHETIPTNLFPLVPGHRFEFGGHLTSGSSETKISGSENLFARWTILGEYPLSAFFDSSKITHITMSTATVIMDSLSVPGVLPQSKNTPVFVYFDFIQKEYFYLTNLGNVFRTYSIYDTVGGQHVRGDSLRFITLAAPNAMTGNNFTVFKESFTSYFFGITPITLTLEIVGNFERKENLSLVINDKDTTVTTYYLSIMNYATMGTLAPQKSVNAKFWLAEGIGPVQFFLAGDSEAPGSFRTMVRKNF